VTLRVVLAIWDHEDASATREVELPAAGLSGVRIVLPRVGEVAGVAVEADGRPAAGVDIGLTKAGKTISDALFSISASSFSNPPSYHLRARTGADGTFRFVGALDGERYDVGGWDDAEQSVRLLEGVTSGASDVRVVAVRHGVLPRAVDARDGRRVDAEIHVSGVGDSRSNTTRSMFGPNDEGFRCPPGSRVVVMARAFGYDEAVVEHVVSKGPGFDEVTLRMSPARPAGRVAVRCVDEAGRALPWPDVRWSKAPSGSDLALEGRTEGSAFVSPELTRGRWRLRTHDSEGFGNRESEVGLPGSGALRYVLHGEVSVVVDDAPHDVPWTLASGGALRIGVRGADGELREPGDMRSLGAKDATGRVVPLRPFHRGRAGGWSHGTGERTLYETQALPAGDYDVVWYEHVVGGREIASARASVRVRETTDVTIAAPAGR